jgi:hypothetical protein
MNKPDPIPFRLTIGVTGHRSLENIEVLREKIKIVIDRILENFLISTNTQVLLKVLSPLAEGSDRLVAEEILNYNSSELKVVLPLCEEEYLEDFPSEESKSEFKNLLMKADYVLKLNDQPLKNSSSDELYAETRKQAYEEVGRYIVDHSDVLIALWDKSPAQGKGGTADIVKYAESKRCPLFIINTNSSYEINFIEGNGINKNIYKQIDDFNSFKLKDKLWFQTIKEKSELFFKDKEGKEEYRLPEQAKQIVKKLCLPYYAYAEIFAMKHQSWYKYIGLIVFWMAFLSVSAIGYGAIILGHIPKYIFGIELFFLLVISILIYYSNKMGAHKYWIETRFLAEHLRIDIILTICGLKIAPPQYVRHIEEVDTRNGWMILTLEYILNKIPVQNWELKEHIPQLKEFIKNVWIDDQINYHLKRKGKLLKRNETLERIGEVIFYSAIIIAIVHIVLTIDILMLDNILVLAVLLLPALGATITAIRTHRDYKKIANDSMIMVNNLQQLRQELDKPLTSSKLNALIRKTEKLMREDTEDWLLLIASKELEKAV